MKTHDEVMLAFDREILRTGKSRNTRKTYAPTVSEFTHMMIRREITGPQGYFDYLSTVKKLHPNGVNYALNPLKFFYEQVLKKEFGQYNLPQRNYSKPMRSVLTMREILSMMAIMDRIPSLQAGMIAGSGLRVESDMLTLRLKDIRIPDRVITIYEAKGNKSRAVKIPEFLVDPLEKQIAACRRQWERDRAKGIICPHPQESLMRKLSRNTFGTLPWYWLFPSRITHGDERWYSSSKQLVSGLREAAGQLGITQRVNPHSLRHSYATGLLRDGVDVRVIQENMGHTSLATTEIYLHTAGLKTAPSPLDTEIARNVVRFARSA